MPDDDGQDAFDTPDRESPTPSQNDDMEQNFSRGGADDNPPERDPSKSDMTARLADSNGCANRRTATRTNCYSSTYRSTISA